MKWINADQQVTVNIYDDEHEEYFDKIMTVEEMLDTYTADGCPTIYANPEPKTGHWIKSKDGYMRCDKCGSRGSAIKARFCHHCGARMESEE